MFNPEVNFCTPDMLEQDVREAVVRPFLLWLGYKAGTEANIRTEMRFGYDMAYFGRQNPKHDFKLPKGRPDYLCELIGFGRWIIEVKRANHKLTTQDSYQAHTYATHPEIAAKHYLITNGNNFALYRTGHPEESVISWELKETNEREIEIANYLSPEAMRNSYLKDHIEPGKPLARGLGGKAFITGGFTTIARAIAHNPLLQANLNKLIGLRNPITSGEVGRLENGQIEAVVNLISAFAHFDPFAQSIGMGNYIFQTSDSYISTDLEKPTIFQNMLNIDVPEGTAVPNFGTTETTPAGFPMRMSMFNQATGFIDVGNVFKGFYTSSLSVHFPESIFLMAPQELKSMLDDLKCEVEGHIELQFK